MFSAAADAFGYSPAAADASVDDGRHDGHKNRENEGDGKCCCASLGLFQEVLHFGEELVIGFGHVLVGQFPVDGLL